MQLGSSSASLVLESGSLRKRDVERWALGPLLRGASCRHGVALFGGTMDSSWEGCLRRNAAFACRRLQGCLTRKTNNVPMINQDALMEKQLIEGRRGGDLMFA